MVDQRILRGEQTHVRIAPRPLESGTAMLDDADVAAVKWSFENNRVLPAAAPTHFAVGKRNFPGQRQRPRNGSAIQWADCRDTMRARIAASSGLFALNREISV